MRRQSQHKEPSKHWTRFVARATHQHQQKLMIIGTSMKMVSLGHASTFDHGRHFMYPQLMSTRSSPRIHVPSCQHRLGTFSIDISTAFLQGKEHPSPTDAKNVGHHRSRRRQSPDEVEKANVRVLRRSKRLVKETHDSVLWSNLSTPVCSGPSRASAGTLTEHAQAIQLQMWFTVCGPAKCAPCTLDDF